MNDELEREYPVTLTDLGHDLAIAGRDICEYPGAWFFRLAWNLTLAALLQTAADRAVLAEDIAWLDKPLTPREMEACNAAGEATDEWV